jgi:enamine deaminase RidA (YjgF/YER057c/UK114 family)
MVDSFNPPGLWSPFGAFSLMAIQGSGQIVYLKGQVALDHGGQIVGRRDMRAQTRKALENVRDVLRSVGGEIGDIVSLTHYVIDIAAFMQASDIRREFFFEPYPVTTTVQVVRLYDPDLVIEITAIAEIPRQRFKHPSSDANPPTA